MWVGFAKVLVKTCAYPRVPLTFIFGGRGSHVGFLVRIRLFVRACFNVVSIPRESTFFEHLTLMSAVLAIPSNVRGDVAEFGCFKGATTANLSLACSATGRRLIVFDSFQGLPESREVVENIGSGKVLEYRTGAFLGTLAEVKANVRRGGCPESCTLVEGFFEKTLPKRPADERYAMIFEDADLPESVRSVLIHAWPRLVSGGVYYCHEALDYQIVQMFFDQWWWKEKLGCRAPGFVGSGIGLPLQRNRVSCLGYAIKLPAA